jgi:hypothetical protein
MEKILNGEMEQGLIMGKVSEFNRLEVTQQHAYMLKVNDRIKQITKPRKLLAVLLFLDRVMRSNSDFSLPELTFPALKLD